MIKKIIVTGGAGYIGSNVVDFISIAFISEL
jgi:nucleoside-diphosphate-sugar epimerase